MNGPEPRALPWGRILVEGLVIILSILAAFGVDAWWDERQEERRRDALMDDLRIEISANIEALDATLLRQRRRADRIELLLGALNPEAPPLSADSVRVLQDSILGNPSYDPSWGILDLLIQSGDLALLEDRELRSRLAGLPAFADDYLGNQDWILERQSSPEVIYGTGSLVLNYSDVVPGESVLTEASPETRDRAAKFWTLILRILRGYVIGQGEELLVELREIEALLSD